MSKTVLLDAIEKLEIPIEGHANEIGTRRMLLSGIKQLHATIKRREIQFERATGGKLIVQQFGAASDEEKEFLDTVACFFHWFGVSICNYVRLTGFLRGMSLGHFTRKDLRDPANFKTIKESAKAYVESIPEIEAVRVWRNKVFAHFAITDPIKEDNISTLEMSVIHPVTFEGKYFVGGMTMFRKNSEGSFTSELPRWSLTEVFEALEPRYWPGMQFIPPPESDTKPDEPEPNK
jgi:hypothetical protein